MLSYTLLLLGSYPAGVAVGTLPGSTGTHDRPFCFVLTTPSPQSPQCASTSELSFPFGLSASDSITETDETGVHLAPLGARFLHSLQHTPAMLAVPWLKVALTLLVIMAPYTRSLHQ